MGQPGNGGTNRGEKGNNEGKKKVEGLPGRKHSKTEKSSLSASRRKKNQKKN